MLWRSKSACSLGPCLRREPIFYFSVYCEIFFLEFSSFSMKYLSASVCCCRCIIIVVIVLLTIGRISRICVLMPFVSSGTFSLFASAPRGLSCRGTPVSRASTSPRTRPRPAPAPRRSEPSFLFGLRFTLSKKLCLFFCVKFLVFVSFQILNVRSGSLTPYMYFCVFRFGSGSRSVMTLPRVALMCLRGKASSFPSSS